jgi:hypothetical protein
MREPDIHCPECSWRPAGEDLWQCTRNECNTVWNTFWTRGVCPGCSYQWRNTQCLACNAFSPHEHWYHYPDPDDAKTTDAPHVLEA